MRLFYPLLAALGLITSFSVKAHTPYLNPFNFEPVRGDTVTLDASFTELFLLPEVAFDNNAFAVLTPAGEWQKPDRQVQLTTRTVIEHQLQQPGTYRFSTGRRFGRVFKVYELNGERHALENPKDPVPKGGKLLSFFQSVTLAETYVSKGGPTATALAPRGEGIEIVASTHPNELFTGDSFSFRVLFEGLPLAKQKVDVFYARYQQSAEKPDLTVTTNARGEAAVALDKPGSYLLRTRHRADAPDGAKAPTYSHTYTLVLEAFE